MKGQRRRRIVWAADQAGGQAHAYFDRGRFGVDGRSVCNLPMPLLRAESTDRCGNCTLALALRRLW